ncbi:hypothetical protein L1987_34465 [Smallanthus sonchifolius]|uniref:Uncharacterized protein n=1 Tax=Smallanthus sonchifolius TaxID=185202 RepID=A0ACB9HVL9_9ASTR|nr:hypothetical protein L1987_34465 [Smallanthus sonchifolius]
MMSLFTPNASLFRPPISSSITSMATDATNHRNSVRYSPKRHGASGAKCQTNEGKKRKKIIDKLNDAKEKINDLGVSGGQSSVVLDQSPCAFCHSSKQSEGSGPFMAFAQGKEIVGNVDNFSNVIHVHFKCLHWAPRI